MKRKIRIMVLCACLVTLTACGNQASDSSDEQEKPMKEEVTTTPDKEEMPKEDATAVEVTIYAGNDNADGFITTPVTISSLDANEIAKKLVENGVLPADVEVLSLKEGTAEGNNVIDLDLSSHFLSYLQGRGSAGEYITMGSICNTYLDAYGCSDIKITIEGASFETGHTEYNRYMSKFSFE